MHPFDDEIVAVDCCPARQAKTYVRTCAGESEPDAVEVIAPFANRMRTVAERGRDGMGVWVLGTVTGELESLKGSGVLIFDG